MRFFSFSGEELRDADAVDFADTLAPDFFCIRVVTTLKGDVASFVVHALASRDERLSSENTKPVSSWGDFNLATDNCILVASENVFKNPSGIFLASSIEGSGSLLSSSGNCSYSVVKCAEHLLVS